MMGQATFTNTRVGFSSFVNSQFNRPTLHKTNDNMHNKIVSNIVRNYFRYSRITTKHFYSQILKTVHEVNGQEILNIIKSDKDAGFHIKNFKVPISIDLDHVSYVNDKYGFYLTANTKNELNKYIIEEYAYLFDEFYFTNYPKTLSAKILVNHLKSLVDNDNAN